MSFTSRCPTCGGVYRLLDKYAHDKISCVDCRKPFVAEDDHADFLEVAETGGPLPARGWLLVCPACGHTQLVADGPTRQAHCAACDTALPRPVIPSKPVRRLAER